MVTLDQRLLPNEKKFVTLRGHQEVADEYPGDGHPRRPGHRHRRGLRRVLSACRLARARRRGRLSCRAQRTADYLATSRPTAVNLFWASSG